jgi:hypothetical protein
MGNARSILMEIVKLGCGVATANLLFKYYPDVNVFGILFLIMIIIASTHIILDRMFPVKTSLLISRMNKCLARKKYGPNYCAVCEDGYECAKTIGE